ncbi:tetratricopeptide repeat protein, partial [bacterium]|nr:tetratricopeptide repeat protein [bacterium]
TNTYQIREGFFDLWLSIGHSRQQNIVLPRLVEFLEKWYAEKLGRERKRQQIWNSLRSLDSPNYFHQVKSQEQLLNYLSDIGASEEKAQNKFEMVYYYLVNSKVKEARTLIREIKALQYERPYYFDQMLSYCVNWISNDIEPATLQQIEDTILCWKLQKFENTEELSKLALKLASSYLKRNMYELNISFLRDILRFVDDPTWMILLHEKIALSYEKLNNPQNALNIWKEILQIADNSGDLKSKGLILNNISQIHQDLEEFDVALDYLNRSLGILQKINDLDGQGTTLNNISTIFFSQGYYEKALEQLEEALVITRRNRNLSIEGITLSNISLIYQARGDFKKALEYMANSLINMRKTNNRYAECTTLNNISQIYLETGNLDESLDHVNLALSLMEESKNNAGICLSLFNRGNVYWQNKSKNQAVLDWLSAFKIATEHQVKDILSRLEKLSISLGENGLEFWKKTLEKLHEKEKGEADSSF